MYEYIVTNNITNEQLKIITTSIGGAKDCALVLEGWIDVTVLKTDNYFPRSGGM